MEIARVQRRPQAADFDPASLRPARRRGRGRATPPPRSRTAAGAAGTTRRGAALAREREDERATRASGLFFAPGKFPRAPTSCLFSCKI